MIIDRIYEWAHIQPDRIALVADGTEITYATFARSIEKMRGFFLQQRLPKGSTVALLASNLVRPWNCLIAARAVGLNTISVANLGLLEDLGISNVSSIVTGEGVANHEQFRQWLRNHPGKNCAAVPDDIQADVLEGEVPKPRNNDDTDYGSHILLTSGTTGIYKMLLWTSELEEGRAKARAKYHGIDRDSVVHIVNFGLWSGTGVKRSMATWTMGGTVIADRSPDVWKNFFSRPFTTTCLVPIMIESLTALNTSGPEWTPRPALCVAGAAIKAKHAFQVRDRLNCPVKIEYASSELSTPALHADFVTDDDIEWFEPDSGREVSIVNEQLEPVPTGDVGYLRIRLNELDFNSYYQEKSGNTAFRNGYFLPGDTAVARDDGRIRILGRVDDVINLHGQKGAVGPIESDMERFFGVRKVCLFSHMTKSWQQELVVAIEASALPPSSKLDEIRRDFKSFDSIHFTVLDQFPRTETGKVQRLKLKNLVTQDR